MPQHLLATMITTTTYGTWLPGDRRGYVDKGVILPGDPVLLDLARRLLKSEPVYLTAEEQNIAFDALVRAADEFGYNLLEVSIESWHAHWLIDQKFDAVEVMVGRLKTRMRQAVNRGRIWTSGYDSRYCFDDDSINGRRRYIRNHRGWRPRPGSAPRSPTAPPWRRVLVLAQSRHVTNTPEPRRAIELSRSILFQVSTLGTHPLRGHESTLPISCPTA